MEILSPVNGSDQNKNGSSLGQNSVHKNGDLQTEGKGQEFAEVRPAGSHHVKTEVHTIQAEHEETIKSKSDEDDGKSVAAKKPGRSGSKKKSPTKPQGRRYSLRSSLNGVRVLRSMSKAKNKTPVDPSSTPAIPIRERRKRRGKVKRASKDEYAVTRKRLRYLLTRMNFEQNLLDAYSGEGWKGQSLEKIKPEKELERAKSEIVRCKLKIRDLFHHLDSLLSDGRLQESLFDSDGQVCSEDIFCAKCGSKDLSADNDIILCDGTCDRGFHQKCLNPPLLSENIPPGDEGWLCPGCDCKVDCIDLLNEFRGSHLKIKDTWEKVFPEASASANGDQQYDEYGLPSDDSEDNDYDPDLPEVHAQDQEEGSSSDESDFTCSSEDLEDVKKNRHNEDFGFLSDDSEDDDYDPNMLNPDDKIQKDGSSSDESDFTSDSDDFCTELCQSSVTNDGFAFSFPVLKPFDEERNVRDGNQSSTNSKPVSLHESDLNQDNILVVSGKRQRERLDYKKLYDETYGNASSDSSDDEDWSNMRTSKKGKKDVTRKEYVLPNENVLTIQNYQASKGGKGKVSESDIITRSDLTQLRASQTANEYPSERNHQKLESGVINHVAVEQNNSQESNSNGKKATTPARKSHTRIPSEKLLESFGENQYPNRQTKETLAEELGLTVRQVSKWFENARHSMRVSAKEVIQSRIATLDKSAAQKTSQDGIRTPDMRPAEKTGQAAITIQTRIATPRVCTSESTSQAGIRTPDKGPAGEASQAAITIQPKTATPGGVSTAKEMSQTNIISPDKEPSASFVAVNALDYGTNLTRMGGDLGQNSASSVSKRKKSSQAGNTNVGARDAANQMNETMDKDRQKAVARELRKRRLSR